MIRWLKRLLTVAPLDTLKLPARARMPDEWIDHDLERKAAEARARLPADNVLALREAGP